jgi:hypothetical protein
MQSPSSSPAFTIPNSILPAFNIPRLFLTSSEHSNFIPPFKLNHRFSHSIPLHSGSMPSTPKPVIPASNDLNNHLSPSPSPSHLPTLATPISPNSRQFPPPAKNPCPPPELGPHHNDHLLTPPLTPATSLRNASIGTSTSTDSDPSHGTTLEPDYQIATRFLLVSFYLSFPYVISGIIRPLALSLFF